MRRLKNPWLGIHGYNCFGCAPSNENGVQMSYYEEGNEIISIWRPKPQFQGWINTLHGGIQSVLLDEICAWIVIRKTGKSGVTSRMETRFRKGISTLDRYLVIRAEVISERRNLVEIKARIFNEAGELCSEATCQYFTFTQEQAPGMYANPCEATGEELSLEEAIAISLDDEGCADVEKLK
ncbi:MAG: PaaI family thioesterase [Bacteroidales bacterium]|nr:PaaI family thioesterase [Bacteroidales bacterium]